MAYDFPRETNSFDRVISRLLIHSLAMQNKRRALTEVFRVLRPGGEFHLADFKTQHNFWIKFEDLLTSRPENTSFRMDGVLPAKTQAAEFTKLGEKENLSVFFGLLTRFKATVEAQ